MSAINLDRAHFEISRSAEYFDAKELQAQTGQPTSAFGEVVLKELIDNALDACETAGIDPVIHINIAATENRMRICVSDSGVGISESVLNNILNFETRTSDKAAYKSPTRGAQGNAFKTIIGIPNALGGGRVIIESLGLRHEITATANPAGLIDISRDATEIVERAGTTICVNLPHCKIDVLRWAKAFAIFNPHASIKVTMSVENSDKTENLDEKITKVNIDDEMSKNDDFYQNDEIEQKITKITSECENSENDVFYKKVADCSKIKPNTRTSTHWYDSQAFEKLAFLQGDQHDITISDLVRQFDGLSSPGKAKKITSQFTEKMLSDIHRDPVKIERLRLAMQNESSPVQPKALGAIGKDNLLARLNVEGRSWYKQVSGMIDNVPYVFEVLIAESEDQAYYFGVNHSVTFGDYLRQCEIKAGELWGSGIKGALDEILQGEHIVIAHLIGIGLPFLDRGKSNLSLPPEMIASISGAVWSVAKVLHKEHKKRIKDASKADRDDESRRKENKVFIKTAVFAVLATAIQVATAPIKAGLESLPANVRNLFYKVREAIQQYTDKALDYGYFSQNLLIQYWQEYGRNKLIYSDPRGVLYTPHSETLLPLGTFEVDRYVFPDYEYDKILYVEKKGLLHTIRASGLDKKYDMAIIGGEGYASEAVRVLLDKAQTGKNYTIFVLHDADINGYDIARTIQCETWRMPNHNIDVVDIGLFIQDAIDMGLEPETGTRKKELVSDLVLNDIEHEYFTGNRQYYSTKKSWIYRFFELNAMSAGRFVEYIDDKISRYLEENQLPEKVIPPEEVLLKKAKEKFNDAIDAKVDAFINEKFRIDDLKDELLKAFSDEFNDQEFTDDVSNYLIENEFKTWEDSIQTVVNEKLDDIQEDVEGRITKLVMVSIREAT
ncbi:MAG: ATP-binding protein [Methylococcaceae bacterium]|jgi:hypothetical protein